MKIPVLSLLLPLCVWLQGWAEPETFRDDPAPQKRSIADEGWREVFSDPQLHKLVDTALRDNPDLRIAMARVQVARANAGLQGAEQWPKLGLTAGMHQTYTSANDPNFVPGFFPRNRAFGEVLLNLLSFEFDLWGRLGHETDAAVAQAVASEWDRLTAQSMLVSELTTSYYNLLALDAELEVTRSTLETRRKGYRILEVRQKAGLTNRMDLDQAGQLVLTTELAIPDAENRIHQLENRIRQLQGEFPGPVERGVSLLEQKQAPEVPAGLTTDLLLRRPDIRSAQAQLASRIHLTQAAEVAWLPRLTLNAFIGLQSKAANRLLQGNSLAFSINPGLSMPVFDPRLISAVDLADANQQVAYLQYEQMVRLAFREVSDALSFYTRIREIRLKREELVKTLENRRNIAFKRYRGGIGAMLDLLDADRDLFTAQVQLVQSRRDELLSVVQLYRALGGGWKGGDSPPEPEAPPE